MLRVSNNCIIFISSTQLIINYQFYYDYNRVAKCYKECFIETSGGAYNRYANKIFCSWDWGISSEKAAFLQSEAIYRQLEELLWDSKNSSRSSLSCSTRTLTYLIRTAMTTLVACIMCGIGGIMWILLSQNQIGNNDTNQLSVLLVPVMLTLILHATTPLISWSVSKIFEQYEIKCNRNIEEPKNLEINWSLFIQIKYEKYQKEKTGFYLSVVRAYLICAVGVGTLVAFWLSVANSIEPHCWQTQLGQEIYRLVVVDLLVSVIFVLISVLVRAFWSIKSFDITLNSLNLVYTQTLFWLGHCLCPPLCILILFKLFITFYLRKWELTYFCEPPKKFWKAAHAHTLFLALTLLGMAGSLAVLAYAVVGLDVSSCGPFAGYSHVWQFVLERILGINKDSFFWNLLVEIASLKAGVTIFVALW